MGIVVGHPAHPVHQLLVANAEYVQGPQIYQPRFGPTYRVSYSASIGILASTVSFVAVTWWLVIQGDKKRALLEDTDASSATNEGVVTHELNEIDTNNRTKPQ